MIYRNIIQARRNVGPIIIDLKPNFGGCQGSLSFLVYIVLLCKKKKKKQTVGSIYMYNIYLEYVLTVKKRTNWRHVFKLIM